MSTLLWEHENGGGGYYVSQHGRCGINMPWRLHDFYEMVTTPDIQDYFLS